jgi:hypothetical protein
MNKQKLERLSENQLQKDYILLLNELITSIWDDRKTEEAKSYPQHDEVIECNTNYREQITDYSTTWKYLLV